MGTLASMLVGWVSCDTVELIDDDHAGDVSQLFYWFRKTRSIQRLRRNNGLKPRSVGHRLRASSFYGMALIARAIWRSGHVSEHTLRSAIARLAQRRGASLHSVSTRRCCASRLRCRGADRSVGGILNTWFSGQMTRCGRRARGGHLLVIAVLGGVSATLGACSVRRFVSGKLRGLGHRSRTLQLVIGVSSS